VSLEMMLPDLLRIYPQTKGVFDRYGLRGCGGPGGPVESIANRVLERYFVLGGKAEHVGLAKRRFKQPPSRLRHRIS
jgi:hypothetical protein